MVFAKENSNHEHHWLFYFWYHQEGSLFMSGKMKIVNNIESIQSTTYMLGAIILGESVIPINRLAILAI